jgi:hypothetical protein
MKKKKSTVEREKERLTTMVLVANKEMGWWRRLSCGCSWQC